MIFGPSFKAIARLVVLATSVQFLLGCDDQKKVDESFSLVVILNEYALNTDDLLVVTRDWGLREKDFSNLPSDIQKSRFLNIQALLETYGIKSVSIERKSVSAEYNFADSGVFGDSYLSLVYSEVPKESTILNTPEVWQCESYKKEKWYLCKGVEGH